MSKQHYARSYQVVLSILKDAHDPSDKETLFKEAALCKRKKTAGLLSTLDASLVLWIQQHALVKTTWEERLLSLETLAPAAYQVLPPAIIVPHHVLLPVETGPWDAFLLKKMGVARYGPNFSTMEAEEDAIEHALSSVFIKLSPSAEAQGYALCLPKQPIRHTFVFEVTEAKGRVVATWVNGTFYFAFVVTGCAVSPVTKKGICGIESIEYEMVFSLMSQKK